MEVTALAEQLYGISVSLKRYNQTVLLLKKNRKQLAQTLNDIQHIVISMTEELYGNRNYSHEYIELIVFMSEAIADCSLFLSLKEKNYRETVRRYCMGFHNLPRAFLSLENRAGITPKEALEYFRAYIKAD